MEEKNKKEESKSSDSQYSRDILKFEDSAKELKEKYYLSNYDLLDIIMHQRVEMHIDKIPVTIFNNEHLSALEAIVKYLKENMKLGSGKIASMLNRNISTISSTYMKARKKMPGIFSSSHSKYFIPVSEIASRSFSVLESIVVFLKKSHSLSNKEIAGLLNRDSRTIWTIYSRAMKKQGA